METGPRVGLCLVCRHSRRVPTPRIEYRLCELSKTDPRFPKYPRLPVLRCEGFAPVEEAPPEGTPPEPPRSGGPT